jgi:hypothetical protein
MAELAQAGIVRAVDILLCHFAFCVWK